MYRFGTQIRLKLQAKVSFKTKQKKKQSGNRESPQQTVMMWMLGRCIVRPDFISCPRTHSLCYIMETKSALNQHRCAPGWLGGRALLAGAWCFQQPCMQAYRSSRNLIWRQKELHHLKDPHWASGTDDERPGTSEQEKTPALASSMCLLNRCCADLTPARCSSTLFRSLKESTESRMDGALHGYYTLQREDGCGSAEEAR